MKKIMIDLETLDTKPTAFVASLGAVEFDPETGVLGTSFYNVVDLRHSDQVGHGRTLSPATVQWWLTQSDAARHPFTSKTQPVWSTKDMLANFSDFVTLVSPDPKGVEIWGNGSDFDNVILGSLYEAYGEKAPWSYGNNRCFRTLKSLGLPAGKLIEQAGTHHNALDDAKHQAYYAMAYLRALNA